MAPCRPASRPRDPDEARHRQHASRAVPRDRYPVILLLRSVVHSVRQVRRRAGDQQSSAVITIPSPPTHRSSRRCPNSSTRRHFPKRVLQNRRIVFFVECEEVTAKESMPRGATEHVHGGLPVCASAPITMPEPCALFGRLPPHRRGRPWETGVATPLARSFHLHRPLLAAALRSSKTVRDARRFAAGGWSRPHCRRRPVVSDRMPQGEQHQRRQDHGKGNGQKAGAGN